LIREAVKSHLAATGTTTAELARASGVHVVVLYRWLSGSRSISLANAERVIRSAGLVLVPGGCPSSSNPIDGKECPM
jgi:hypothetical protein